MRGKDEFRELNREQKDRTQPTKIRVLVKSSSPTYFFNTLVNFRQRRAWISFIPVCVRHGRFYNKLMEAFDPKWNGALPYSILLGPNGEVLYECQEAIDPLEVKRAIVKALKEDRFK